MTMPAQFPALQQRGLAKFIKLALDFSANETLDPRITFSRTSNATRINAQGLIEYAPHNLLTYSQEFDNASWSAQGLAPTITANSITAPDGTITADKIVFGAGDSRLVKANISFSAGITYVVSLYVKTVSTVQNNTIRLAIYDGTNQLNSNDFVLTSNSWQRITFTVTALATSVAGTVQIRNALNSSVQNEIYIWGAQLNIGSLQPYYTTSVKNLLGYSQNFEDAAWTKSNSSVLYNLLTYSQEFDNASWSAQGLAPTITANSITAPDGTITADKIVFGAGDSRLVKANISFSAGITYAVSLYVKTVSTVQNNTIRLAIYDGVNQLNSNDFVLTSGTWQRITFTVTALATSATGTVQIRNALNSSVQNELYIWGAQLVQGTSPEEYTATTSAPAPIQVMGPFGYLGAMALTGDGLNTVHYLSQTLTFSAIPYTYSAYLKKGTNNFVQFRFGSGAGGYYANFDLNSGVTGTTNATSAIVSAGGGWYRCSITATLTASTTNIATILTTSASATPAESNTLSTNIYIYGAQLSDSASLDPYVYNFGAAPTSSAYYGPRFDYDPVTLAPKGLLIEEQRINILLNSDTLSTQSVSVTAQAYTLSFYGTGSIALSGAYTGSLVGTGVYPNRVQLTFTPTIGTLTLTVTGSVRYANLEAGSFPTSYIPTTSAQVTRTADNASMVGTNFSSWYNQSEGTVSVETDVNYPAAVTGYPVSIGVNFNDSLIMYRQSDAQPVLRINTAGVNYYLGAYGTVWSDSLVKKLALAYQANNTSSAYNGLGSVTDTTVTLPVSTQLAIGSLFTSSGYLNGHLKSFKFFSKRFINTYLENLTQ